MQLPLEPGDEEQGMHSVRIAFQRKANILKVSQR
jgi:hypothetical protein